MGAEPAILFETEENGLLARATAPRGSDVLAVVFSQVRVPVGHFGLSRLFARTAHGCLFLNQPENAWYRGAEAAIDRALHRAIAATRPAAVVLYGSSMGGFGAAATAARWPDARAVLFAPDFRVGEPGSRSAEAGLAERPGEPDLAALLARPRTGMVDAVFGLFDPYDAGVAARLAKDAPPPVRLVTLASTHEVHDHLFSLNLIRRVISTFRRDLAAEAATKSLGLPLGDPARRQGLAALALMPDPDPAAIRAVGLADDPGAALLEAEALAARGDPMAAEARLAALDATIAASPILSGLPKRWRKAIPRRRIALLRVAGRPAEAAAVARAAAQAFPDDDEFVAAAAVDSDTGKA